MTKIGCSTNPVAEKSPTGFLHAKREIRVMIKSNNRTTKIKGGFFLWTIIHEMYSG